MKHFLTETKIDSRKLYFHGSSESRVNELKAPSFEHPFYVTTDLHYAMAFCTKSDSNTGDYEDEKTFTPASQNFVYVVTLNPACKVFDFRNHDSAEFKKIYKIIDKELVDWIFSCASDNFDMDDIYEFVVVMQSSIVRVVDMSHANYMEYTKLFGDQLKQMSPKLFLKACSFCKKNGLYQTWGDYSIHQSMVPILKGLQKQGFHGILTRETDYNEEFLDRPSAMVSTNYAIGMFDKAGLNLLGLVPMKYKWLKQINPSYLEDATSESASEKIRTFIAKYKKFTKQAINEKASN